MSTSFLRGGLEWALMVALVFGAGAMVQAQDEEQPAGGPVIQIGKSDVENPDPNLPAPNEPNLNRQLSPGGPDQAALPKYWIGLAGGPIAADHVLRAHVDIPEHQGLLVVSIVPDSPAAKAGLKQHDILLRANEVDLHEMQDLVDLVLAEGEKKGQIALEVLRRGERETVYLTPEERPADAPRPQFGGGLRGGFGEGLELFGPEGRIPFEFRNFGPGVIVGGDGMGVESIPNGVSVSVEKEGDKPARITVKRGEETWKVVGDDPESLNQLPEDLRPFVEQMLHGRSPMRMNFREPGQQPPMPEFGDGRLQERLDRMEKRMQELMERLGQDNDAPEEGEPAE